MHPSEEPAILQQCGIYLCAAQPGDALLMRPLLLHASRKSTSDRLRRVVHLEFAAADVLPPPLAGQSQTLLEVCACRALRLAQPR